MRSRRRLWSRAIAGTALALGLLAVPSRASAHVRFFVGGPIYPGPYYYSPYYYPYPYVGYAVPPPGWDPGHWEYRKNRWGRWVEVWIPPHLR